MIKMKMSKVFLLVMLLFALTIGACSNASQETVEEKTGSSSNENKKDEAKSSSDYPKKPITWIVPFAPGGAVDSPARTMAPFVEKYLPNDTKLVVVNKAGSAGTIGVTEVFNAKPDGYTIGTTAAAALTIRPHFGDTQYTSINDLQPVLNYIKNAQFLVVPADSPYETFDEWLKYVKENPGEFTYGVSGTGNAQHIAMEYFAQKAGIDIKQVPYDGEAGLTASILGEQIKGGVMNHAMLYQYYKEGKIRPLVNITGVKPEYLKDVNTLKEEGYDVEATFFHGLLVPKDLPEDIVSILHDAFKKALEDPELKEKFDKMQVIPDYMNAEDFKEVVENDYEINREVLKKMGMIK